EWTGAVAHRGPDRSRRGDLLLRPMPLHLGEDHDAEQEYFAPGRVTARIKLPAGQGLWPAFWLLGKSFPPWPDCGELDVMENKGSAPAATSSSVHGPGYFGNTPITHVRAFARGSAADAFHTDRKSVV